MGIKVSDLGDYQGQKSIRIETQEAVYVYHQAGRSLFLLHHEADSVTDCYWPMEGNMTVFGFGRTGHGRKLRPLMTAIPSRFSIGFVESLDYGDIRQAVEKVAQSASGVS